MTFAAFARKHWLFCIWVVAAIVAAVGLALQPSREDPAPEPMKAKAAPTEAGPQNMHPLIALRLCQRTLKRAARDPDTAVIPDVENFGRGDEAYFAWGHQTKLARMRNGLGLEVPVTAACFVDLKMQRISSLTMNGEDLI